MLKKIILLVLTVAMTLSIAGCSGQSDGNDVNEAGIGNGLDGGVSDGVPETDRPDAAAPGELAVRFGDDGVAFTMHLDENDTAAAIAEYVGTAAWRLPIYHYDDYENWEVMQYYDIPSRYAIPSNPQTISSEKAGEVYYSEPNRIVLFYQDAQVSGEFTKVGYFDYSEEFRTAVEENPVLEGWGNKIVHISDGE